METSQKIRDLQSLNEFKNIKLGKNTGRTYDFLFFRCLFGHLFNEFTSILITHQKQKFDHHHNLLIFLKVKFIKW